MNRSLTSTEIRETFLSFFERNDHLRIPASPLVPKNDPTLLYINSGMAPLKPYFDGAEKPPKPMLCNVQTCIRTRDIDDVGDRHHLTFFEMLGSWSIGDYFKDRAVELAYELLVEHFRFPRERLYVTVYAGNEALDLPADDESARAWERVGIPRSHIVYLGDDNFWGPAGDSGPCGPCTEVFFDTGDEYGASYEQSGEFDTQNRYIEIWNAGVFMQFDKRIDGSFGKLPFNSVDTGSGLERMTMILNGHPTCYETDLLRPTMDAVIDRLGGKGSIREQRLITDHMRASTFILAEGVKPGNEGRDYIPRRLIRKCIAATTRLGIDGFDFAGIIDLIVGQFAPHYPHLPEARELIKRSFARERQEFEKIVGRGLERLESLSTGSGFTISGADAFALFATYGLPLDLVREYVHERGGRVDEAGYETEYRKHQEVSRAGVKGQDPSSPWASNRSVYRRLPDTARGTKFVGYDTLESSGTVLHLLHDGESVERVGVGDPVELITDTTPFYAEAGGQKGDRGTVRGPKGELEVEDTQKLEGDYVVHRARVLRGTLAVGDAITLSVDESERRDTQRNHSATHLLHAALREVLGSHVKQAGSLVEAERLRFDFEHPDKPTPEQLHEVERIVNRHIQHNYARTSEQTSYDEAVRKGALAFFGDSYGDVVRVVGFGPVSTELCGGTHVERTGDIGLLRIVSEASIASGVRRIVAVTGRAAIEYTLEQDAILRGLAGKLRVAVADLPQRVEVLTAKKAAAPKPAAAKVDSNDGAVELGDGLKAVVTRLDAPADQLRTEALRLADAVGGVAVLAGQEDGKARVAIAVEKRHTKRFNAGALLRELAPLVDGKGGGAPHLAQGGGSNPGGISALLERATARLQGV